MFAYLTNYQNITLHGPFWQFGDMTRGREEKRREEKERDVEEREREGWREERAESGCQKVNFTPEINQKPGCGLTATESTSLNAPRSCAWALKQATQATTASNILYLSILLTSLFIDPSFRRTQM